MVTKWKESLLLIMAAVMVAGMLGCRYPGNRMKQVVVIAPIKARTAEVMYEGVCQYFQSCRLPVSVSPVWVDADNELELTSLIQATIACPSDAVVSIGVRVTRRLHALLNKRGQTLPVVYLGVPDAVGRELVGDLERPQGSMTGVMSMAPEAAVIGRLAVLAKPDVAHILIPYRDDEQGQEAFSFARALRNYFGVRGVAVSLLALAPSLPDPFAVLEERALGCDMVMGIEPDFFVLRHHAQLAKMCNERGIALFMGHYDARCSGAGATYAIDPAQVGGRGAAYIRRILFEQAVPGDLPVVALQSSRTLTINKKAARQQGMRWDAGGMRKAIAADALLQRACCAVETIHGEKGVAL